MMMFRPFALAALLCAGLFASLAPPAFAASCPLAVGTKGSCAATIGTGSGTIINNQTQNPCRVVVIDNESTTASIAVTDDGTTPALNTAGSWTIPPGQTRTWPPGPNIVYPGPFNALASAASTPATVKCQ